MFELPGAEEADQLTLAFRRFIELRGRALADPRSGCSMAELRGDGCETRIFTFWSRRAAKEFDWFWSRYQPVYGAGPLEPAVAGRRSGPLAARARS